MENKAIGCATSVNSPNKEKIEEIRRVGETSQWRIIEKTEMKRMFQTF